MSETAKYDFFFRTVSGMNTNAYAAGDLVGDRLTFVDYDGPKTISGRVTSVTVVDLNSQAAELDLVLFDEAPAGTVYTNNSALDIADADMHAIAGVVSVLPAAYNSFADNSVACVRGQDITFRLRSGTSLCGALVSRGTPTYAADEDLMVKLGIEQDD